MPGAFASTPRDELTPTAGGLDGTSGAPQSSTAYSSTNPAHGSTAAPASASAAAGTHPSHVSIAGHNQPAGTGYSTTQPPHASTAAPASASTAAGTHASHVTPVGSGMAAGTGYSTTQPPHASTAAPASSTAASGTMPAHVGSAGTAHSTNSPTAPATGINPTQHTRGGDTSGAASIKSGFQGGPDVTAAAHPHGVGSTATHASPLHSHPQQVPSTGTGTATIPVGASGSTGSTHHGLDPSFSNRTLGDNPASSGQYGSLDSSASPKGTNTRAIGRDATSGLSAGMAPVGSSEHHRTHGPHQDVHSGQPGAAVGATNSQVPVHGHTTTLPDRSRVINEPGTEAVVGQTSTYGSYPVGGHSDSRQVSGPHSTTTANILDPKVDSSTGTTRTGATQQVPTGTSTTHHGGATAVPAAGAAGLGAAGTHARTQHDPVQTSHTSTATREPATATGHHTGTTAAGLATGAGAGAVGAHELNKHNQHATTSTGTSATGQPAQAAFVGGQPVQERAAQQTLTGDHTKHPSTTTGEQAKHQAAATTEHTKHQHAVGGDHTKHEHKAHDSHHAGAAGATTGAAGVGAGAGAVPVAGTTEGRNQEAGGLLDKGPASKTIGPHKSNILNVLDPRVRPDPGVTGADKGQPLETGATGSSSVAGTTGTHGATTSHGTTPTHGAPATHGTTATHGSEHDSSSNKLVRKSETGGLRTSEEQRVASDPSTTKTEESHGGHSGLGGLLHRDHPNKLHKDPPSK